MAEARAGYLILSVAVVFAAYAVRALRWKRFCRSLGDCSFSSVYSGTLMGFGGMFLLGRVGEALRPILLARKCRFSVSSMFGIWLLERLFDLSAAAVLLGLSLLLPSKLLSNSAGSAWDIKFRAAGSVLLAGLAGLMVLVVYFRAHGAGIMARCLQGWSAQAGWRRRLAMQFQGFSAGLRAIRTPNDLLVTVWYSAAHWGFIVLAYWLVAHSLQGRVARMDFRGSMLVLVFTLVGSTMQLPGVGGGNQVLSFIALTRIFGVAQEPAAAASILMWLGNTAPVGLVGVPLLIREGWSMADLRRLARAEAEAEKVGAHTGDMSGSSTI